MLEIIAIVGGVLVLAAAAVAAFAATRPDTFTVARSAVVRAPAERIYPLISDLRSMNTWNPFVAPDPAIRIDYSGPDSGTGATQVWSGNRSVGEGRLEIVAAEPPSRIVMQLEMLRPMRASNTVEFTLKPHGDGTTVTWAMSGRHRLSGKIMGLIMDIDRMCGGVFEQGLASLKAKAEA